MPAIDRRSRHTSTALVLITAVLVAGCTSSPPTGTPTTPAPATSVPTIHGDVVPMGAAASSVGDPCVLIHAMDVPSALGATVTRIQRLPESTNADGTSQQCVYATTGQPPAGPGVALLNAFASAFIGGSDTANLDTAGLVVILFEAAPATGPEPPDAADLPPGSKVISGLGDYAVVVPSLVQQGGAAVCLKGNRAVIVLSIEGRATAINQLEQLIRLAARQL